VAYSLEDYSSYKADGIRVEGTADAPQIRIPEFHVRTGVKQPDTITSLDRTAIEFWREFYRQKLASLDELLADIAALP